MGPPMKQTITHIYKWLGKKYVNWFSLLLFVGKSCNTLLKNSYLFTKYINVFLIKNRKKRKKKKEKEKIKRDYVTPYF